MNLSTRAPRVALTLLGLLAAPGLPPVLMGASLLQQCRQAQRTIAQWRKQGDYKSGVRLVLGATPEEAARFEGEHWVFLSNSPQRQSDAPSFEADFNDIGQLAQVAEVLQGLCDQVVFDRGTVQHTAWTRDHLNLVASMLAPGATFYFPVVHASIVYTDYFPVPALERTPERILPYCTISHGGLLPCGNHAVPKAMVTGLTEAERQLAMDLLLWERLLPALTQELASVFKTLLVVRFLPDFYGYQPKGDGLVTFLACSDPLGQVQEAAPVQVQGL